MNHFLNVSASGNAFGFSDVCVNEIWNVDDERESDDDGIATPDDETATAGDGNAIFADANVTDNVFQQVPEP